MTGIPVVRTTRAVRFATIAPAGFRILAAIDAATKVFGMDIVITSGTDSHTTGRHPTGEAYDVRTIDISPAVVVKLYRHFQRVLGARFTVLYEAPTLPTDETLAAITTVNKHATGSHLHIQVKRDTTYPPTGGKSQAT